MNRILLLLPLLMLALLLAPILSRATEPNADQAKAIAEIKKLGGYVAFDEKSPGGPVFEVDFEPLRNQGHGCRARTSQGAYPTQRVVPLRHASHGRWGEETPAGVAELQD